MRREGEALSPNIDGLRVDLTLPSQCTHPSIHAGPAAAVGQSSHSRFPLLPRSAAYSSSVLSLSLSLSPSSVPFCRRRRRMPIHPSLPPSIHFGRCRRRQPFCPSHKKATPRAPDSRSHGPGLRRRPQQRGHRAHESWPGRPVRHLGIDFVGGSGDLTDPHVHKYTPFWDAARLRTVNESHSTAAAVAIDSSKAAVRGEARKWEERRQSERQRKEGRGEARKAETEERRGKS